MTDEDEEYEGLEEGGTGLSQEEEDRIEVPLTPAKRLTPGTHTGKTTELKLRLVDKSDGSGKATYVHMDVLPDEAPMMTLWFDVPLQLSAGSMLGKVLQNFGYAQERFESGNEKVTVGQIRKLLSNQPVQFATTMDKQTGRYSRLVKDSIAPRSGAQLNLAQATGGAGGASTKAVATPEIKLLNIINDALGGLVKEVDDLVTVLIERRENKLIPKCESLLKSLVDTGELRDINGVLTTKAAQASGMVPTKGKKARGA